MVYRQVISIQVLLRAERRVKDGIEVHVQNVMLWA